MTGEARSGPAAPDVSRLPALDRTVLGGLYGSLESGLYGPPTAGLDAGWTPAALRGGAGREAGRGRVQRAEQGGQGRWGAGVAGRRKVALQPGRGALQRSRGRRVLA